MSVATIGPIAVTVPEHVLTQADVKEAVGAVVPLARDRLEAVLSLFDGAASSAATASCPWASCTARAT
jgi:hypothetical protein